MSTVLFKQVNIFELYRCIINFCSMLSYQILIFPIQICLGFISIHNKAMVGVRTKLSEQYAFHAFSS